MKIAERKKKENKICLFAKGRAQTAQQHKQISKALEMLQQKHP